MIDSDITVEPELCSTIVSVFGFTPFCNMFNARCSLLKSDSNGSMLIFRTNQEELSHFEPVVLSSFLRIFEHYLRETDLICLEFQPEATAVGGPDQSI
jgi:hypothetical protein